MDFLPPFCLFSSSSSISSSSSFHLISSPSLSLSKCLCCFFADFYLRRYDESSRNYQRCCCCCCCCCCFISALFVRTSELLFELDERPGENESESEARPPREPGLAQHLPDEKVEDELESVGDRDHDGDLGVVHQGVDERHGAWNE